MNTTKDCRLNLHDVYKKMTFGEETYEFLGAKEWLEEHPAFYCWINGSYMYDSESSNEYINIAPKNAFGKEVADGYPHVETAVSSSALAQKSWEEASQEERCNILYKLSNKLKQKAELFLGLDKNFHADEVMKFIDCFDFYSDMQTHDLEEWRSSGVALIILSDNSPLWILGMNVAAALSAGCSVIVKPSASSLFSSFLLAEISTLELPSGLLNIVPGSVGTTEKLVLSNVDKVVYNGSNTMACHLHNKSPDKKFSFLDANHTASIILDTCDLQGAVDHIFSEIWNAENKTSEWNVDLLVVQEAIYFDFLQMMATAINRRVLPAEVPPPELMHEHGWNTLLTIMQESLKMGIEFKGCSVNVGDDSSDLDDAKAPPFALLTARNNKEAVKLINNFPYCLATSVWTENLSEAIEISSQLECSIVWVNCHGITDVAVPFEPLRDSGNGYYGGVEGAMDFMEWKGDGKYSRVPPLAENPPEEHKVLDLANISNTARCSQSAFSKWRSDKNIKMHVKKISGALSDEGLPQLGRRVNFWAHAANSYTVQKRDPRRDLYVTQSKSPVGVILIISIKSGDPAGSFASLVSPAIASGNAVIVAFIDDETESNLMSTWSKTVKCFTDNLPKGILTTVRDRSAAYAFAMHPDIKAIWLLDTTSTACRQINELRKISLRYHKRFWVMSDIMPENKNLFWRHCLRSKCVWFSKINHCP